MKKVVLGIFVLFMLLGFKDYAYATSYVTLEGLDITNSGGSFNSGDPNFSTGPITIDYNGSVAFKWWGNEVDTCNSNITIMDQAYFDRHYGTFHTFGTQFGSGGTVTERNIKQTKTFFITCNGLTAQVTIIVRPPKPPTLDLTANPTTVNRNGSTTLTWTSTNAESCVASGGWNGGKTTNNSEVISNLVESTNFILTCTGPAGEVSDNVNVTVVIPPPAKLATVNLSATPTNVDYGSSTSLSWTVTNAISCVGSGGNIGWAGNKSIAGGSQFSAPLSADTTFTLTCTNADNVSVSDSINITVTVNNLLPVVNLSVQLPAVVEKGKSKILIWNVENAVSCIASSDPVGKWSGPKDPTVSSENITNLTANTTFTLTCTNAAGTSSNASVSVTVMSKPVVTLLVDPTSVNSGENATLTWTVQDAVSCVASNGWSGAKNIAGGSEVISNITTNKTFVLTCSNPVGSTAVTKTVTVKAVTPAPTFNFISDKTTPPNLPYNSAIQLSWNNVTNATSCTGTTTNSDTNWAGNKSIAGGSQIISNLKTSTTFTLACTGIGGTTTKNIFISINGAPAHMTFEANPVEVASAGSTTLTWTSENTTSCTATNDKGILVWNGSKELNNSIGQKIENITANTNFLLSCTGTGGTVEKSILVTTVPIPTVTLTSNKTEVLPDQNIVLSWNVNNATSCIATSSPNNDDWNGNQAFSNGNHNKTINKITADTSFSIVCNNSTNTANSSVPVKLIAEKLTFNNTKVLYDANSKLYKTKLSWVAVNVQNCVASTNSDDGEVKNSWTGNKLSSPSPYQGETQNVIVKSVLPEVTKYTLTCSGIHSNKIITLSKDLHTASLASSGVGIPDYEEN